MEPKKIKVKFLVEKTNGNIFAKTVGDEKPLKKFLDLSNAIKYFEERNIPFIVRDY